MVSLSRNSFRCEEWLRCHDLCIGRWRCRRGLNEFTVESREPVEDETQGASVRCIESVNSAACVARQQIPVAKTTQPRPPAGQDTRAFDRTFPAADQAKGMESENPGSVCHPWLQRSPRATGVRCRFAEHRVQFHCAARTAVNFSCAPVSIIIKNGGGGNRQ
jgi:hypothetical protein